MNKDTFEKIEQKKAFFLLALEEFDGGTLDIEEMKVDYEFLFQTIEEQKKELDQTQDLIRRLYKYLGSNADADFRLWKETEKYCKEKKLV